MRVALQLGHNYIDTDHLLLGLMAERRSVAAGILHTLDVDDTELRSQIFQLTSSAPASVLRDEGSGRAKRPGGPRCPSCKGRLDNGVGYRVLPVPLVDDADGEPVQVLFVYCLRCNVMLAHTPADNAGTGPGASRPASVSSRPDRPAGWRKMRPTGAGVTGDRVEWSVTSGGADDDYLTLLEVRDRQGAVSSGGMGGPKLHPGDLMNVYTVRPGGRGPAAIIVRCATVIDRLTVTFEDGTSTVLDDCGVADGLRFAVLLVDLDARPVVLTGADKDGTEREQHDLRHFLR